MITYIIISRQMPFDDQNKLKLYKKILKAEYDLEEGVWPTVSDGCKNFIRSLLVVEVEQ